MLERMSISEVLETLSDARQAPLFICADDLPAFAHKGLTAKQALSAQMRHYIMSVNGEIPNLEINSMVTKFRYENAQRSIS